VKVPILEKFGEFIVVFCCINQLVVVSYGMAFLAFLVSLLLVFCV